MNSFNAGGRRHLLWRNRSWSYF